MRRFIQIAPYICLFSVPAMVLLAEDFLAEGNALYDMRSDPTSLSSCAPDSSRKILAIPSEMRGYGR